MTTIKLRRGTASQWNTADPTLLAGEPGFETDTGRLRIGDGSSNFTDLDYLLRTGSEEVAPTVGSWFERGNTGSQATIHLTAGVGFTGPYVMGIGNDHGAGAGLTIANKAQGPGLTVHQQSTVSSSSAFGLYLIQESATAPAMYGIQNAGKAALMLLQAGSGTAEGTERLTWWLGTDGDSLVVDAKTTKLRATNDIDLAAGAQLHARGNAFGLGDDTGHVYNDSNGMTFLNYTGSPGTFFGTRLSSSGQEMKFQVAPTAAIGAHSWLDVIRAGHIGGGAWMGFFGAAPVAKPVGVPATAAGVHAALVTLGLIGA